MKKILIVTFSFFAFISVSNAQFGIRAGVNLANQSIEAQGLSIGLSNQIGFQLGVNYDKMINENLSFRPGLLFTMKGAKFSFLGVDSGVLKFNYLEVPLDFVYHAGSIDIHAGPYVGFLLTAKADGEDVKDDSETLDYGLNFGGSYNITSKIGVGVNYGLGLANIAKTEDGDDSTIKNKVLSFFVNYKL
ncbi:MAG: hypothetical protein ACI86M_003561 [Saprospiraceae bacterium]|jgi:hypothetical protein